MKKKYETEEEEEEEDEEEEEEDESRRSCDMVTHDPTTCKQQRETKSSLARPNALVP